MIAPAAALPLWRALCKHSNDLTKSGARLRPDVRDAIEALRASAMQHLAEPSMSANGHGVSDIADMPAESAMSDMVSTSGMAELLGVGERHARRLAADLGIEPVGRGVWRREDVHRINESRP